MGSLFENKVERRFTGNMKASGGTGGHAAGLQITVVCNSVMTDVTMLRDVGH